MLQKRPKELLCHSGRVGWALSQCAVICWAPHAIAGMGDGRVVMAKIVPSISFASYDRIIEEE